MRTLKRSFISIVSLAMLVAPTFTAASVQDNTRVWAWIGGTTNDAVSPFPFGDPNADALGWMSTNCYTTYQQELANPCDGYGSPNDYGVNIDLKTGLVTGNSWIGGVDDDGIDTNPIGWLTFDYDKAFSFDGIDYNKDSLAPDGTPWISAFGKTFMARVVEDPGDPNRLFFQGWGRIMSIAEEGRKLGQAGGWVAANEMGDWGWVKLSGKTQGGTKFGLEFLANNRVVRGSSYSGGGTIDAGQYSHDVGLGYISGAVGAVNFPYFNTEAGDIYAREKFGSPKTISAPGEQSNPPQYAATYLILSSGSISAAVVENEEEQLLEDVGYSISYPQVKNRFTNVLGKIPIQGEEDVRQLTTVVGSTGKNVFGEEVRKINRSESTSRIWRSGNALLNGGVLAIKGDLTIDNALTFQNGNGNTTRGDGVIYVQGDLIVNNTTNYESISGIGGNMERVASVVWIVEGDVVVSKDMGSPVVGVTDMVGAYFVLGRDDVDLDDGVGTFIVNGLTPVEYQAGQRDEPFQLEGLVVAEHFQLDRQFINDFTLQSPAEHFINDGRFLINPPRSMRSVADALPVFSTSIPD